MTSTKLIIADSERNADLYYATHFLAPDPFIFTQIDGRRFLIMSDLEIDRAKSQARVDEVLSFSKLAEAAHRRTNKEATLLDVVDELLKIHQVTKVEVPWDFSVLYADGLRRRGFEVEPQRGAFFPERAVKSEEEIRLIIESLRATEAGLETAFQMLRDAKVDSDGALLFEGMPLTSERIRRAMHVTMLERDCVGQHTIIAGGAQGVDPHNEGSGVLRANQPIVIDVFPQHAASRYFADLTRTVVKGKASEKVRRMFDAVQEGQEIAYRMIKDGTDGSAVHKAILDSFEALGFLTQEKDGRMQGFFHGTGHGVGLEIHESPRVSQRADILRAGMVVTVEPGLYYLDAGGMRIEDMVVVRRDRCQVISQAPKILEL